jgi:putative transposase
VGCLCLNLSGWVYVAFVVDAYARRILGWRTGTSMSTELVMDALEQAIWTRQRTGADLGSVVAHSDRGSQYVSIRHTERLAQAWIAASVGPSATASTTPWPRRSTGCTRPS